MYTMNEKKREKMNEVTLFTKFKKKKKYVEK